VFRGDVCIHAAIYPTRAEALRAAQDKKLRRLNTPTPPLEVSRGLLGCARAGARRDAAA
jgi:hypothetical protein